MPNKVIQVSTTKPICSFCNGQKALVVDGQKKPCLCQRKALVTK